MIDLSPFSCKLLAKDFDYKKALKDLPHVNHLKKRAVPGKYPEEFTSIFHSFRAEFPDTESLFGASYDDISEVDLVS